MRHVSVPQYDSLTIKKISMFLMDGHDWVFTYMPDNQEIHKVSREWICNVCASVLKTTFTDWLRKQINERNETVVEKGDLNIEMDEDVAAAFK